jgi:Coenzyme PQQ synthesis protein D (PqqD)
MALEIRALDNSIIVAAKEQISSDLGGETVILDLKSGMYYGLNQVGASIWNMVQAPKTVKEIRDRLLAEYNVDEQQCDRDLFKILEDLAAKRLIEVINEAAA